MALHSVNVNRSVSVAGDGGLTFTTNVGQSDGNLSFGPSGYVTYLGLTNPLLNPLTVDGTPYVLVNSVQMLAQKIAVNRNGNFALSVSYDAGPDGTYTHTPIPALGGRFEGLGNTISNLVVKDQTTSSSVGGLIAELLYGAQLRSLRIKGAQISMTDTGPNRNLGGVVGDTEGEIANVSFSGVVIGTYGDIGGIAGSDGGPIRDSSANGSVRSTGSSSVNFVSAVGGLVGRQTGELINCHASARVKVNSDSYAGGLIGWLQYDVVSSSYATGTVTGGVKSDVGGFVGRFDTSSGSIDTSTAYGAVSGGERSNSGGFIGRNVDGHISNSTSYGTVNGGTESGSYTGGFVGFDSQPGYMTNDAWDMTTSGINDPSRGAGNIANDPGITGFN